MKTVIPMRAALACVLLACSMAGPRAYGDDALAVAQEAVRKLANDPGNGVELERLKGVAPKIADLEERGRFCLIYHLGAMIYVHATEAEMVARYIQTKLPGTLAAEALVNDCAKSCDKCQGGTSFTPCKNCDGNGVCPICKGAGASTARGMDGKPLRCSGCNGTRQCRVCLGVGGTRKPCGTCGGRGTVRDAERAKIWYSRLLRTNELVRMPVEIAPVVAVVPRGAPHFAVSVATKDPPLRNAYCQAFAPDLEARQRFMRALKTGGSQSALRAVPDIRLPFVAAWEDVVPVLDAQMTQLQREQRVADVAQRVRASALWLPECGGIGYVFVKIRDGVSFKVNDVAPYTGDYVEARLEAPDGAPYVVRASRESRTPLLAARRGETFQSNGWFLIFEIADAEINFWGNELAVNNEDLIRRLLAPPPPPPPPRPTYIYPSTRIGINRTPP